MRKTLHKGSITIILTVIMMPSPASKLMK